MSGFMPPAKLPALFPAIFTVCLLFWLAACSRPEMLELQGATMGTSYSIKLPAPPEDLDSRVLQSAIDDLLNSINAEMSTYDPVSTLSQINVAPAQTWYPLPDRLLRVLLEARQVYALSEGAFDPTVGPLVNLWGFGPAREVEFPEPAAVKQALERVGYQTLVDIDGEGQRLRKQRADVSIDLSAIAKGFAVDEVAQLLEDWEITRYLVEIGGELRVSGLNAQNKPWRVAIEVPSAGLRQVHGIVNLEQGAIATSGDYRNFFEHEGLRYSHTINPDTGYPVMHNLASVSVIDASAMRADALATAIMGMGPEKGMALAEREKLAVWMVLKQGEGWVDLHSPAMKSYQVN